MDRFVAALIKEIGRHAALANPKTVFFGGGTPTLLTLAQWRRIFAALTAAGWTNVEEFTIEGNPATISLDKATLFRDHGVNRFSMGVQSLDAPLLERLGRVHTREMVFRSVDILRRAGFDNLNLDLMFAIPGQTMAVWSSTLDEILDLKSEHLSCYEVIYEADTPLYEQLQAGAFDVDEEQACEMYDLMVDRLAARGYRQYEIANFARSDADERDDQPRRACRHNINYWTGGEYLGLGPAAAGHLQGQRYQNWANTDLYCQAIEADRLPRDGGERLNPLAKASESAAFSLRMNRGIDLRGFEDRTGFRLEQTWARELETLVVNGWAEHAEGCFRLTRRGLRFADAAGAELLKG